MSSHAARTPAGARNILLVEDEPTLQRILGSVLADAGHHVDAVGTAEQAIERLEESADIDLVLTDKNLPRRSGLELLAELRDLEREGRRLVPVVMVTGYPSRDSVLTALAHDVDGYLVKPFRSLSHAVDQLQAILQRDPLPRRRRCAAARAAAAIIAGSSTTSPLPSRALLLGATAAAADRLQAAGVDVTTTLPDEGSPASIEVVIGADVALLTAAMKRLNASGVLVDPGATFADVVELIHAGGGVVLEQADAGESA